MRVRRSVGAARPGSREARAARRLRRARARPLPSSRRQRGGRRERAATFSKAAFSHLSPGNGRMPGGGRAKEEADRRGGRRGDTALTKQNKNQLRALQPTRVLYATPGRVRLRAPEGAQDMALYTAAAKYKAKKKLLGRRELRTQPCQQPLPQHALVSGAAHPTRVQAAHGTRGNALNH